MNSLQRNMIFIFLNVTFVIILFDKCNRQLMLLTTFSPFAPCHTAQRGI